MSSNVFVAAMAGIVMAIFGAALAAALIKVMITTRRQERWASVPGRVNIVTDRKGRQGNLAIVTYRTPSGADGKLEVPTGSLPAASLTSHKVDVAINPDDESKALIRSGRGNLAGLGCFTFICIFFAIFGVFTIVRVFTH